MRKNYHVTIHKDDLDIFDRVVSHLSVSPTIGVYMDEDGPWHGNQDYTIHLSKYELLALQLMCKIVSIDEIEDKPLSAQYETILYSGPNL